MSIRRIGGRPNVVVPFASKIGGRQAAQRTVFKCDQATFSEALNNLRLAILNIDDHDASQGDLTSTLIKSFRITNASDGGSQVEFSIKMRFLSSSENVLEEASMVFALAKRFYERLVSGLVELPDLVVNAGIEKSEQESTGNSLVTITFQIESIRVTSGSIEDILRVFAARNYSEDPRAAGARTNRK